MGICRVLPLCRRRLAVQTLSLGFCIATDNGVMFAGWIILKGISSLWAESLRAVIWKAFVMFIDTELTSVLWKIASVLPFELTGDEVNKERPWTGPIET